MTPQEQKERLMEIIKYQKNHEGWSFAKQHTEAEIIDLASALLSKLPELGYVRLEDRPKIICLCGSTRFTEQMLIKQWELTKQGYIVLTWCVLPESYFTGENKAHIVGEDKSHIGDQEGVKELIDEVHKRKIDLAGEVFILNIDGYIGESTRSEIEYAQKHNKVVKYEEPPSPPVRY